MQRTLQLILAAAVGACSITGIEVNPPSHDHDGGISLTPPDGDVPPYSDAPYSDAPPYSDASIPPDGDAGMGRCPPAVASEPNTGHHPANGAAGDPGATVLTDAQRAAGCMGANSGCHNAFGPSSIGSGGLEPVAFAYGGEAFTTISGGSGFAGGWVVLGTTTDPPQFMALEINQNGFFYASADGGFPVPSTSAPIQTWICATSGGPISDAFPMTTELATVQQQPGILGLSDGNCSGPLCHGTGQDGGFIYDVLE